VGFIRGEFDSSILLFVFDADNGVTDWVLTSFAFFRRRV